MFKAFGALSNLMFRYSLLRLLGRLREHSLLGLPRKKRLVIKVLSCLMYFFALFIRFANVLSGFQLMNQKNFADVVPFCMTSMTLDSSK